MVGFKLTPFVVILFSISLADAQYFDPGVVRELESINEGKLPIDYSGALCAIGASNAGTSARDMNDCAIALCGPPSENKSVYLTNSSFEQYITPALKKSIDKLTPELNKAIDKAQQVNQAIMAEFESKILKDGVLNTNPKEWTSDFRSNLTKTIFETSIDVTTNLKMPAGQRVQVKAMPPLGATEEFKAELKEYAKNYAYFANNNSASFMENGIYSNDEMVSIAKERLMVLKNLYNDKSKSFPDSEKSFFEAGSSGVEEMITRNIEDDIPSIFSNLEYMEEEAAKREPSLKKLIEKPTCSNEDKCEKVFQDYLKNQNLPGRLAAFKQRLVDPKARKNALNSCKAQFLAAAIDSSDKDIAKEIIKDVKKEMGRNVFTQFSLHSRKILEDYFEDKIKTSQKSPKAIFAEKDVFSEFKNKLVNYANEEVGMAPVSQEVVLAQTLNISDNESDINAFADPVSPCTSAPVTNAWDSYLAHDKIKNEPKELIGGLADLPNKDHVFVSDFTCHHQLRGKSIVAHELGHAINQIFATNKLSEKSAKFYKELRDCATSNYIEFVPGSTHFFHPGDGLRTEEDTADLFAYMTFSNKADLFSCAIVKPSFNESSYLDLNLIKNDGDVHSTPLLRVIMEAINKGVTLPVSCEKVLGPARGKLRVKKCLQ